MTIKESESEVKTDRKLPDGTVNEKYSTKVELKEEPEKGVNWKLTKGSLPKGLELNSTAGEIAGIPEEAGDFIFTLQEQNTGAAKEFTLKVKDVEKMPEESMDSSSEVESNGDVKIESPASGENLEILEDSIKNLSEDQREKAEQAKAEGKDLVYEFETEALDDDAPGAEDISSYNDKKGFKIGQLFDLSLILKIKGGEKIGNIYETNGKISFSISIPESLRKSGRTFYILRFHDGSVDQVGSGSGDSVKIKTDRFSTYAISYTDEEEKQEDKKEDKKKDKDDDDDDNHYTRTPTVFNPDEITVIYKVNGAVATNMKAGKQAQGPLGAMLFKQATPAGWQEAFAFNMAIDGKTDYTLKNGIMTLYIPAQYIKANRQYAILALDKNGQVHVLADTDHLSNAVTVNLNLEGYAFELIYKD